MKQAKRTLVYTHGGGRLGNQVMRFAHWIAWSKAHPGEVEIVNFAFWPYADFFSVWRDHRGCAFPLKTGLADKLARLRMMLPNNFRTWSEGADRMSRFLMMISRFYPGCQRIQLRLPGEDDIDLGDASFLRRVASHRITTCSGWRIASWNLLADHQQEVRAYFQPALCYARPAKTFVAGLREHYEILIGVLARQSDYTVWAEGRFYFSSLQYAEWIRQIQVLYAGRRVGFVLASEDWQDPAIFEGLPVHLATGNPRHGGHWFENWVELSLCDCILSPPSTFSATAAFAGGISIWPVTATDQQMAFEQVMKDGLIGAARHTLFSIAVN
jgi:hypothetical protein